MVDKKFRVAANPTVSAILIKVMLVNLWTHDVVPWFPFYSGQTQDTCAVSATILQKKIQTNVESFTLTAKLNASFENFLLWACVQNEVHCNWHPKNFIGVKFGFSGHFMHRFHTNFALIKVWTDSNFNALKNWKWCCFLRLTTVKVYMYICS